MFLSQCFVHMPFLCLEAFQFFSACKSQPELAFSVQLPYLPRGKCSFLTVGWDGTEAGVTWGRHSINHVLPWIGFTLFKLLPAPCVCYLRLPGCKHLGQKGSVWYCVFQALSSPARAGPSASLEFTLTGSKSLQGGPCMVLNTVPSLLH